jgi:hypothetical protein
VFNKSSTELKLLDLNVTKASFNLSGAVYSPGLFFSPIVSLLQQRSLQIL